MPDFQSRLLPLCDGRPGLRGLLPVACTEPPESAAATTAVLDFISSDETLDRYDEIISASGWHLENYLRNPVFQNSHQYGDILFTLGKALITEVRSGLSPLSSLPSPYLFQRIEFAVDANPIARIAYNLYKHKFLRAVSVGFIPLRWQDADALPRSADFQSAGSPCRSSERRQVPQSSTPPGVNPAQVPNPAPALPGPLLSSISNLLSPQSDAAPLMRALPPFRRKYLEQELLEVSAVSIPANPNALSLALKSGAIEKSDLRETIDLLRSLSKEDLSAGLSSVALAKEEALAQQDGAWLPPPELIQLLQNFTAALKNW